jgi:hypothetical protein
MRKRRLLLGSLIAVFVLLAIPTIAGAQTIDLNVYLLSRTIHFVKGQAVSIDFCNVDRVTRDVKMYFVDEMGNTLKSSQARVLPGQTVSLNFTFGELPRGSSMRVGIRGAAVVVDPPEPDSTPPTPDLSLANLEIYDTQTGRTSFGLLLPAIRNPNVLFPTDQ